MFILGAGEKQVKIIQDRIMVSPREHEKVEEPATIEKQVVESEFFISIFVYFILF